MSPLIHWLALRDRAGRWWLRDRAGRWWLCARYGHTWTARCDPPACADCGRTKPRP
jgi:hypothetical protein